MDCIFTIRGIQPFTLFKWFKIPRNRTLLKYIFRFRRKLARTRRRLSQQFDLSNQKKCRVTLLAGAHYFPFRKLPVQLSGNFSANG